MITIQPLDDDNIHDSDPSIENGTNKTIVKSETTASFNSIDDVIQGVKSDSVPYNKRPIQTSASTTNLINDKNVGFPYMLIVISILYAVIGLYIIFQASSITPKIPGMPLTTIQEFTKYLEYISGSISVLVGLGLLFRIEFVRIVAVSLIILNLIVGLPGLLNFSATAVIGYIVQIGILIYLTRKSTKDWF